ncbi:MAG TPA: DUF3226 domain-containing protein [Pirellulales bacterium]|jgi:hypothetical protein
MSSSMQRPTLYVEGSDDDHTIRHLLIRSGIDYDKTPWPANYPEVKQVEMKAKSGGIDALINLIAPAIKLSTDRPIAFVVDADSNRAARWAAVRAKLLSVGLEPPEEMEPRGFIGQSATFRSRVGVWLMPDNQRDGTLEHFLRDLISTDDTLIGHSETATATAKEIGAKFAETARLKAQLHAWLAWQEEPGCPYGTAMRAHYFRHDNELAKRFVAWFRDLFGIPA